MRRNGLGVFSLALLGGLLAGCAGEGEVEPSSLLGTAKQELSTISSAQTDTAVLGTAYHTERKKVFNLQCVRGQSELRGNSLSELSYQRDMNFSTTLNTLAGGLSVGLSLPVVSAEASARIATKHASDELSETHHLSWVGNAQKEVFKAGTLQLTPEGAHYATNRPDLLEDRCGNEFVTEVHRGASLLATLKIEFFSSQDRLEVGGKINVNILAGLVEAEGSLDFVEEEKKKRTKISVQVVQRGGRPERLLTIIPDNVMYCSLKDPAPCFAVFGNLINYAKNDFSAQLAEIDRYNVLKYVTQSYADSGLDELIPSEGYAAIADAVRQKITLTERKLRDALADEERAASLLTTGASYMTNRQRDLVRSIGLKASNNVVVYAETSLYCYQHMNDSCLSFALSREAELEEYDPASLDIKPPIKGDVTEDGCVDMQDYTLFQNNFGLSVAGGGDARCDINLDGWIDDSDYTFIAENWGEGC